MRSLSPSRRAVLGALSALSLVLESCAEPSEVAPQAAPTVAAVTPALVVEERVSVPLPVLPEAPRGLGSMTARIPGTSDVVGGVRLAVHKATVTISDGIAHTEIEEEFRNETGRVLEGRLVFPLPADAALGRLALWVGKDLVEGEVVEKKRADLIFRGIVDDTVRPRDPALLDVVSGGRVSLRIFPIAAHGSRKVVLAYDQILRRQNGVMRYIHPLSLGTDRATPIDELSVTVNGVSVLEKTGVVPSEDVVVTIDKKPPAVLRGSAPGPARKGAVASERDAAAVVRTVVDVGPEVAPFAGDVVMALDVSEGQSAASLTAQIHLADAVLSRLKEGESFALLACDSGCTAFPEKGVITASAAVREEARRFLSALAPGGPADTAGALVSAAAHLPDGRHGQVIVMSDGTATAGELSVSAQLAHVAPRLSSADVRVVGVGRAVDDRSLSALARGLGATYDRMASGAPLAQRIEALAESRRVPIVRAPAITLPAGLDQMEPAEPTPTRAGEEVIVLARAAVSVPAPVEGAPTPAVDASRTAEVDGLPGAATVRLWARERVAALETRGDEANAEITALALHHRLLSRTTSLLVLENDRMFAEFGIPRSAPGVDVPERPSQGEAAGYGTLGGDHKIRAPQVRMGATTVSGRLPPEVIQRIVRQNFGRFRMCYENGLRNNPNLQGRVTVRFVIGRDGSVSSVGDGGSDLPNAGVVSCVVRAFSSLNFPQPEGGIVVVVYPIVFSDGGGGDSTTRPQPLSPYRSTGRVTGVGERLPFNSALNPPPWSPPPAVPPSVVHRAGQDSWLDAPAPSAALAARVAREPERRRGHLDLIRQHLSSGRMEDAYKNAAALVALDPDLPAAREMLAEAAAASGHGVEAVRATEAAAALDPRSVPRRLAAARAALAVGDERRACAHVRALGELQPKEHASRAQVCRDGGAPTLPALTPGGFEARATSSDGASLPFVVLTPAGRVLSPWTGQSEGSAVFGPLMAGTYRTLIVSAARKGEVTVRALGVSFSSRVTDDRRTATISEVTIPDHIIRPSVRW